MNVKAWISAMRLRTLPLALSSIGTGSFLAFAEGKFKWIILILASITTVFLQILSNLANDYGDTKHGADSQYRQGPMRAVQSGIIPITSMKAGIILFMILAFISGIWLLYFAFGWKSNLFLVFLGIGILSIAAAYTYTAGNTPYGYAGFGDISVLIFFGIVGVIGTFFLHTGMFNYKLMLPALALGVFSTAVLNVNNIRDLESDKKAGKRSIPVRIGRSGAVMYHWALLAIGFGAAAIYVAGLGFQWHRLIFLIPVPLFLSNALAIQRKKDPKALDPYLKQLAISIFLFMIFFGLSVI